MKYTEESATPNPEGIRSDRSPVTQDICDKVVDVIESSMEGVLKAGVDDLKVLRQELKYGRN